jgi:hypothetical protein
MPASADRTEPTPPSAVTSHGKWTLLTSRQLYFLAQVPLSRGQNRWNISLFVSNVWLPENIIMAGMRILFPDMKEFS